MESASDQELTKWLEEPLDVEFAVSTNRAFLGARLLVAFGGPNIWVDTRYNIIEGRWGGDHFEISYADEIGLHDAYADMFEDVL